MSNWLSLPSSSWKSLSLMLLILLYWVDQSLAWLSRWLKPLGGLRLPVQKIIRLLDPNTLPASISRIDLIKLALKNMQQKKARTQITIGGMTIGIAAIVFLVSIGYGLQDLVIKRVARLEEMRQTDISVPPGSNLRINDKTLRDFERMNSVYTVAPMIALVAKASYQNSSTDLVAYGVTRDYLEQSAIQPAQGEIFTSNEIVGQVVAGEAQAEGAASADGAETAETTEAQATEAPTSVKVKVNIESGAWLRVRDQADPNAELLGYTRSPGSAIDGELIRGKEYLNDEEMSNRWLEVTVPIWEKSGEEYVALKNDAGNQINRTGYMAVLNLTVDPVGDELIPLDTQASTDNLFATKQVNLPKGGARQVVVNRSTLKVLGLPEEEAVGKTFELSFVATGDLLSNKSERLQSTPIEYTIIGVTPDEKSPVLYVPFVDLRSLGLVNFSQVKVTVADQEALTSLRHSIEALGYNTSSVADTVSQINNLFATARTMLAILGMVALAVASLGMFNTLTVSLLERTHEVGLMKAMGMKSSEVRDLFLAESMIMGSLGGVFGLLAGFVVAKALELIVSGYAIMQGVGYIPIVSVPVLFAAVIVFLSLVVGLITGIFPARRATRISALNALRYE